MENSIVNLSILKKYRYQQVIINQYVDEGLVERDGFMFEEISLTEERISFMNSDQESFVIQLEKNFRFYKSNDFQNFYIVEQGILRIEIYFP